MVLADGPSTPSLVVAVYKEHLMNVVKDCNVCHGKTVVRVRFVNDSNRRYGQTRVITCPDCKGRGSWISREYRQSPTADWTTWLALQEQT